MNSRRIFLKNSSMLAAGLGLSHVFAEDLKAASTAPQKKSAASDRVNLGVVGVGMGCQTLEEWALPTNNWAHLIAMCDVDKNRRASQAAKFKKEFPDQTKQLQEYDDFRKLLENKDIDGVILAAPDHWHAYMFLEALKAGKAIYTEKPIANSIAECNKMMEWQGKYKRVVTTGLWQVSQFYFRKAFDILKTGVLGDVYKVHCWMSGSSTNPRPAVADEPAPDYLDYEMWLGPAPSRPYNSARVRSWRSFWDYGGGTQTDWTHWIDSAYDGLKILGLHDGKTYPKSVVSSAYKHPDTFSETPSVQTSIIEHDKFHIVWEQQVANLYNRSQGVAWIGNNATLVCQRESLQLIPQGRSGVEPIDLPNGWVPVPEHSTNWMECIRTNNIQTNSPVEKGAFASIVAHSANIAFRTGTKVNYDSGTQKFLNNTAANALLRPAYRNPWDNMWNQ